MWEIKDTHGKVKAILQPGEWRSEGVKIGTHLPPPMIKFWNHL